MIDYVPSDYLGRDWLHGGIRCRALSDAFQHKCRVIDFLDTADNPRYVEILSGVSVTPRGMVILSGGWGKAAVCGYVGMVCSISVGV